MTEVLFGLWLAATLRLLVPFGWIFTRLRRVVTRAKQRLRPDVSRLRLGNNSRGRRLSGDCSVPAIGAVSLAAHVSVVVGAVYFAPRMLVWAFDTP
jgi:hypothetical protein